MEKIIFITPHLSTGGLPQYLYKKIKELQNNLEIFCIEYNDCTGGVFVVQKDKIESLIKKNLITLSDNKQEILNIINSINPDYIHFEEISETFVSLDILDKIYLEQRKYKIFETSHCSYNNTNNKIYLPDAFIFVSPSQLEQYNNLNIPMFLVEYPIEKKQRKNRSESLKLLGLDINKTHIINVGLFTPGKNQNEIFEYAKLLPDIQFHFIGNQAGNFADYWKPLMNNKPKNCIIWGERNDVDIFYNCMDILLFTSKLELNPLVIREGISWDIPILMYNLPIYQNEYNKFENIKFLTDNFNDNLKLIDKNFIPIKNNISKEIVVITAYPDTEQKEKYLNELIDNVTSFGYDIMISSHYNIPEYIKNKVKYCILDLTNNLLYREENKEYGVYNSIYNKNSYRIINKTPNFNHSYAVYLLWKNAINNIDIFYNKVHILDYDCIISDKRYFENHSDILNLYDTVVYESNDILTLNRFTTNLFSFKINEKNYRII